MGDVFLSGCHGSTPHHRCLIANMALDPLASVGGMLTILDVLARRADCCNAHLAHPIAGVKKAGLDVHDISLARGSADVLFYEVSPANSYCSGTRKRIARVCSVARTVSSRRRICGHAMELVKGHEFFHSLTNRGALSILDSSFKSTHIVNFKP